MMMWGMMMMIKLRVLMQMRKHDDNDEIAKAIATCRRTATTALPVLMTTGRARTR